MKDITTKSRVDKLKIYLKKLQVEMVMSNYTDGWYKQWVEDKINLIKEELKIMKND